MTPVANWILHFNQKLFEIMPYYNQLYKLYDNEFNPFDNTDYKRDIKRDDTLTMEKGTSETSEFENKSKTTGEYIPGVITVNTEISTPQTELETFMDNKYLSGASKSTPTGMDESNSSVEGGGKNTVTNTGKDTDITDAHTVESMKGKVGGKSYIELLTEYRNNIINVDNMILDDLEELFFMVY